MGISQGSGRFGALLTAMVTPFDDEGSLGVDAALALARYLVSHGSDGLVVAGTTGEGPVLSDDEVLGLWRVLAEALTVPVVAGTGTADTRHSLELTRLAQQAGVAGVLVVTPYYSRPPQAGLVQHFTAVADVTDLPVLLYDIPARAGRRISLDTMIALATGVSNIVGVKDATGDMARPSLQRLACGDDWLLLSGDDPSALGYMAHGGAGVISVTANVAPGPCAAFCNAALAGDFETARHWQQRLVRLHKALFADASPAPTKFALASLGLCAEEARLPIAPCSEGARAQVREAMREAGVAECQS